VFLIENGRKDHESKSIDRLCRKKQIIEKQRTGGKRYCNQHCNGTIVGVLFLKIVTICFLMTLKESNEAEKQI